MIQTHINHDGSIRIDVALNDDGTFGIVIVAPKFGYTLQTKYQEQNHFSRTIYGNAEKL